MTFIRKVLAACALVFLGVVVAPAIAFADEVAPVTVDGAGSTYVLSPTVWKIVTGLALPFVIALITKASANPIFKGVVGIVVAAVDALVIRWTTLDGSMVFDQAALQDIFMVYGVQLLTYLGVYRQANLNAKMAPNTGLG